MKHLAILMVGLTSLGMLAAACSSSDDNTTSTATTHPTATSGPAATTPPASGAGTGTTVAVTVQEWSINPTVNTAPAGDVMFNVKNIGPDQTHEFVVLRTDLAIADLPRKADGSVDEAGAGITSPGEIGGIAVGASNTTTVNLTPGRYLFICNLIDKSAAGQRELHFNEGMHAEFTVR